MVVVSKFEYAILQEVYKDDPEKLKQYRSITDEEISAILKSKAENFARQIRIKK